MSSTLTAGFRTEHAIQLPGLRAASPRGSPRWGASHFSQEIHMGQAQLKEPTPTPARDNAYEVAKREASGKWSAIIGYFCPELAGALVNPGMSRITCPVHGTDKRRGDGFRVFENFEQTGGGICNTCGGFHSGIDLIAWARSVRPSDALTMVEGFLGIEKQDGKVRVKPARPEILPRPHIEPVKAVSDEEVAKRMKLLDRLWSEAVAITDASAEPARAYLRARGIANDDYVAMQDKLRFHPSLFYASDEERQQRLPGIVAEMHDADGLRRGLHRTYLDRHEPHKAAVKEAKKVLRRLDMTLHGGIFLQGFAPLGHHVQLAEGLETGASVGMATGRPIIACTTAQLLHNWTPFKETKYVTVWADNGAAGVNHSRALKARLEEIGLRCRLIFPWGMTPSGKERDWNDVLQDDGEDAIRTAYAGDCQHCTYC